MNMNMNRTARFIGGFSLMAMGSPALVWAQQSAMETRASEVVLNAGTVHQFETVEKDSETSIAMGREALKVYAQSKRSITLKEMTVLEVSGAVRVEGNGFIGSTSAARIAVYHEGLARVVLTTEYLKAESGIDDVDSRATCAAGMPSGSYTASNGNLYRNGKPVPNNRIDWPGGYITASGNNVHITYFPPETTNPNCAQQ